MLRRQLGKLLSPFDTGSAAARLMPVGGSAEAQRRLERCSADASAGASAVASVEGGDCVEEWAARGWSRNHFFPDRHFFFGLNKLARYHLPDKALDVFGGFSWLRKKKTIAIWSAFFSSA